MAEAVLRVATMQDADAIDALMKASIRALFPSCYDTTQTASAEEHVGAVDRMLIADGTYYVGEADGAISRAAGGAAATSSTRGRATQPATPAPSIPKPTRRVRAMFVRGDWTRRGVGTRILDACRDAARAEGFSELALMATMPGVPLYERYGFVALERAEIELPDGCRLACERMAMPIG